MNNKILDVKNTNPQFSAASTIQKKEKMQSAVSLQDNRPKSILQKKQAANISDKPVITTIQKKANNTGLPDNLKSGIENLSGHAMDDVKVHYNSDKPAQLNAHAYAQGTDIHVASGQEKHLAHEAWHVVQQKQGRVKPTLQMKGKVNVNDDKGLESEADVMGAKALQMKENKTIQKKRQNKKANWNQKQKDQNERLSQRTKNRYMADKNRKQKFMDLWLPKIQKKRIELLNNKEVKRAKGLDLKDENIWIEAVNELIENLQNIDSSNSLATRTKLRTKMESAWKTKEFGEKEEEKKNVSKMEPASKSKEVGEKEEEKRNVSTMESASKSKEVGEKEEKKRNLSTMESASKSKEVGEKEEKKRNVSKMPPKIWYTTQEIFDAKAIFLNHRYTLTPGGKGHEGVAKEKEPDFFSDGGVGDAQNVDTSNVHEAIEQSIGTVTSKVAKYPKVKVTVTIGLHNCPKILDPENVAIIKHKIKQLEVKPSRVYLVCGSLSSLAYP